MSDKIGWKGRDQQLRDSRWGTRTLCRSLGPAKKNKYALEPPKRYTVACYW